MATELLPESSRREPAEVRYRRPRPDLYTALLVVALVALIVGCVMLYLELQMFDFKYQGAPSVSWRQSAAPTGLAHLPLWSTDARSLAAQIPL